MILLIDNYDSFTYNLFQSVAQIDDDIKVIRNDRITVSGVKQLKPSGIILSPGPGKPKDAGICVDVVKQLAETIPILGVCLGHQAIALAFGGKVIQSEQIVHGKKADITHNNKGIYEKLPSPFEGGRYHSLIVERESLPHDLMIEAEGEGGMIMGIKHRKFASYGIQFHPESILTPQGDQLIQQFLLNVVKKHHVKKMY